MTTPTTSRAAAERAVRIGFLAVGGRDAPPSAADIAAVEQMGADSLWAPGHVAADRPMPEVMTSLARLAELTERVTVGSAVLLAPLYHPVIVAKQVAELDRLTGGRVALGVGVGGEYPSEFRACQVALDERGPRCDEAIDVMRRLWTGVSVDNAGRFWPFDGVRVLPPPSQPGGPPVIVAGRKPPAMRRAARLGDGWMPFLYSPSRYAASVAAIRSHADSIERDLSGFQWMCFVYVSVHDDVEIARAKAVRFLTAGQAGDGARFESLLDSVAVAGTVDDVTARLQQFVDAGVDHFIVALCDTDIVAGAETVLTRIADRLEAPRAAR